MRWLFTVLVVLFNFYPVSGVFVPVDPIDSIAGLLKTGNAALVAQRFSPTIDLTLMGEENIYSAAQAEIILRGFFKMHPPKTIKVLHRVNSNANYRFGVYLLTTSDANFRVSVSLKNSNGNFVLDEMRVEPEKNK
jgi:hypothetical protein